MKPNDQQNYWQPQDEAEAPASATPDKPASPTASAQPAVEQPAQRATPPTAESDEISWEASEVIEHAKGPLWYAVFSIVVVAVLAVTLLWLREWIISALVIVVAVAVVIMARRPPHVVHYTLNHQGLVIDQQMNYFSDFRTFGVVRDEALFAIKLIPVKRFSPEVMVYFSERDGEKIVDILGAHLPMEDMKLDLADRIIRKIRL